MRGKCLEGEKKKILSREVRKNESNFMLEVFKEITARWIEDLSRSTEH